MSEFSTDFAPAFAAVPLSSAATHRSPITAEARAYVRSRATLVMEHTCQITRGATPEGYDENTLVFTAAGIAELVYEGPCRIWELSSAQSLLVGEAEIYQQPTQMSIPWDESALIRRYDQVLVTTAPEDSQLVGERFEIQTIAKGGELRASRRFEITGVM
jgi:hypothetical protein